MILLHINAGLVLLQSTSLFTPSSSTPAHSEPPSVGLPGAQHPDGIVDPSEF